MRCLILRFADGRRAFICRAATIGVACLLICFCQHPSSAQTASREFYVAPDGTPQGDGSVNSPWDLATALAHPRDVKPGSTVWLRGGTYRGVFTSRLTGTAGLSITLRAIPGERAIIDAQGFTGVALTIYGAWTIYWGFEVMNSDPRRITDVAGSHPAVEAWRRDGVSVYGTNVKLINLTVYDNADGIGLWMPALDSEIYGCLIFNNGWLGPDRGHGHGIYAQNRYGNRRIADVVSFNNFGRGMEAYSAGGYTNGYTFEGNASFNNYAPAARTSLKRHPNLFVGTVNYPAERLTISNNYLYHHPGTYPDFGGNLALGYKALNNKDVIVRDNYVAGGSIPLNVFQWQTTTVTGNTFFATDRESSTGERFAILTLPRNVTTASYIWNFNNYFNATIPSDDITPRFNFNNVAQTYNQWRSVTGFDADSQYTLGRPMGTHIFVRPNEYEPSRSHIVVYNWDARDNVDVDVSAVLPIGAVYQVRNVQDYFGAPALSGTFDGTPLTLPMKDFIVAPPIGYDFTPASTAPDFGVFILTSSAPPDLSLTQTAAPETVLVGGELAFNINVTNDGFDIATDVTLRDALPVGINFVTASSTQGSCEETDGNVTCNLGTLAGRTSARVTIYASPTAEGTFTNSATVTGNGTDSNPDNNTASTIITAATSLNLPIINIRPTNLDFGTQLLGTIGAPRALTIANDGDAALHFDSAVVVDSSEFIITSDPCTGTILAPNATCNIAVSFSPTALENRSARLMVTSNASAAPQHIALTGAGIDPFAALSTYSVDFGNQVAGTSDKFSRAEQNVTVTNSGVGTLIVNDINVSGENANEFSFESPALPLSIPAGESATITIRFAPTATDFRFATLSIADNAFDSPRAIELYGTGVLASHVAFGDNSSGQLGDGTRTNRQTPNQIAGLSDVKSFAAGEDFTLALKIDGTVLAWGKNGHGQLGSGTFDDETAPLEVNGLSGVIAIAAGDNHALALKADGTLWTWGANESGQLGDGTTLNHATAMNVTNLENVVAIAAGGNHSLALLADKRVRAWGANAFGQLGDGTTINRSLPTQVYNLNDAVALAGGDKHSLALKSDGTLWTWGGNGEGQLGSDATQGDSLTPVQVDELFGIVTAIAARGNYCLALQSDGTVWQWGETFEATPAQVDDLQNVTAIAAGKRHRLALKSDGAVMAWGDNVSGQLGDATTTSRATPTPVIGTSGAAMIAAGGNHSLVVTLSPTMFLDSYDLDYGEQRAGTNSVEQMVTISSDGIVPLVINQVAVGGDDPNDFRVTSNTCPRVLETGATCKVGVRFNPTNVDARHATLNFYNNAFDSPQVISLTGVGTLPVNLSVIVGDAPDPVNRGAQLTYDITIANAGPGTATNVTVIDTLPAGVSFVSIRTTQGVCSVTSRVACELGDLVNGGIARITLIVSPTLTTTTTITNSVTVTGNQVDSNLADNSSTATTLINSVADLLITLTDAPDPVAAYGDVTYTATVKNNGPYTATSVVFSDRLPTGLSFVSVNATQGSCVSGSNVTCNLGTLARNATANITLVAKANTAGTVTNTASVSGAEIDSNTSSNTASQATRVLAITLTSLTLTPTTVIGACQTSTGKVTLSSLAPTGGIIVTLASLNAAAIVPSSVIVPGGASSQTFAITTQSVAAAQGATIRATLGAISKTATLTLKPLTVQELTLTPNPARGGTTLIGSVTLTCAATSATTVTLSSSSTAVARPVTSSVVIAAETATANFQVTTSATSVTRATYINARAGGVTKSLKLTVTP